MPSFSRLSVSAPSRAGSAHTPSSSLPGLGRPSSTLPHSTDAASLRSKMLKAVRARDSGMVHALLCKGADPNECEDVGATLSTPLHHAAKEGSVVICQILASYGADVNARDKTGQTPLHRAAYWGRLEVVDFLVYVCADPTITDLRNQTAEELAFHRNNQEVYEYLASVRTEGHKERSWSVKRHFSHVLNRGAHEYRLQKLQDKMARLEREVAKAEVVREGSLRKGVSAKDREKLERLQQRLEETRSQHHHLYTAVTKSKAEAFDVSARVIPAPATTTWVDFLADE